MTAKGAGAGDSRPDAFNQRDESSSSHTFGVPGPALEFTGERYVPQVGDQLQHEHFHRYLFALQFCRGKHVLDVACGEGYGSAILASVASGVVGVDASAETIAHAATAYPNADVQFIHAQATEIPLPDASFDVVVSFETLEHMDEHEAFVQEAHRVLREGGLLLLSTPDRSQYLVDDPPNPYHIKEVDHQELTALLARHFNQIRVGGQRSDVASLISFPGSAAGDIPLFFERETRESFAEANELPAPVYLIAMAADGELPPVGPSAMLDADYLPGLHRAYRKALEDAWGQATANRRDLEGALAREAAHRRDLEGALARGAAPSSDLEEALRRKADLEAELESVTMRCQEAEAELEEEAERRHQVESQLAAESGLRQSVKGELDAAYSSMSWRITSPLRRMKSLARFGVRTTRRLTMGPIRRIRASRHYSRLRSTRVGVMLHTALVAGPAPTAGVIEFDDDAPLDGAIRDAGIIARIERSLERAKRVREAERLITRPLISILLPTYETPVTFLDHAVGSVFAQSYPNWELIVVDDGSSSSTLHSYLTELANRDPRVSVTRNETNGGISDASNTALAQASGDFVAMLDHDDELHPDALLHVVDQLASNPDLDVVFTDQRFIETDGAPGELLLKPDWAPTLFRGVMYVGHLLVVRRRTALEVGGFDSRFDNVQDFEFMLRVGELTDRIAHVPEVLYGWRRAPGSVALRGDAKDNINELQAQAVSAQLKRLAVTGVAQPHRVFAHRAEIVPQIDAQANATEVCVVGGDEKARSVTARALEPLIGEGLRLTLEPSELDSVVRDQHKTGGLVILLEAGLVPIGDRWLSELWFYTSALGAPFASGIIVRNGTVEEAGLILDPKGNPSPALSGRAVDSDGYAGSLSCAREVVAVSGRCVGFQPAQLRANKAAFDPLFASLDAAVASLSLRLGRKGMPSIVTPHAIFERRVGDRTRRETLDELLMQEDAGWPTSPRDRFHNPRFRREDGGFHA
jgi:SAM-dependent methyltransferase